MANDHHNGVFSYRNLPVLAGHHARAAGHQGHRRHRLFPLSRPLLLHLLLFLSDEHDGPPHVAPVVFVHLHPLSFPLPSGPGGGSGGPLRLQFGQGPLHVGHFASFVRPVRHGFGEGRVQHLPFVLASEGGGEEARALHEGAVGVELAGIVLGFEGAHGVFVKFVDDGDARGDLDGGDVVVADACTEKKKKIKKGGKKWVVSSVRWPA
mmetsp:Transcript_42719/g.100286  ORF Transcript_42719/g.100286 Transcript_42719/m.100286 type:complete len:208 (-) Transcript_42719:336-959(-)